MSDAIQWTHDKEWGTRSYPLGTRMVSGPPWRAYLRHCQLHGNVISPPLAHIYTHTWCAGVHADTRYTHNLLMGAPARKHPDYEPSRLALALFVRPLCNQTVAEPNGSSSNSDMKQPAFKKPLLQQLRSSKRFHNYGG